MRLFFVVTTNLRFIIDNIETGKWFNFHISQRKHKELVKIFITDYKYQFHFQNNDFYLEVRINGQRKIFEKNEKPITYKEVKVWAGDAYYPGADAEIKNFISCTSGNIWKDL